MNAIRSVRLFTWLPVVGIVALVAWATQWWVALIAVAYLGITIGGLPLYRQRLRRRFANDPDGARAYEDRAQRRVFRWGKAFGLLSVGMLLGFVVFVIVFVAVGGH